MKIRPILVILLAIELVSCALLAKNVKFNPEYTDVDPKAQVLVNEYLELSKQHHVTFDKKVTVGFKKINNSDIIGICNYGTNWREIDLDSGWWDTQTSTEQLMLIFHELTHCYCGRDHDYEDGTKYLPTAELRLQEAEEWSKHGGPKPGRFEDACPKSIMYPIVIDETCAYSHYSEYIEEMFNRCTPY